jgi:hypothetical protein
MLLSGFEADSYFQWLSIRLMKSCDESSWRFSRQKGFAVKTNGTLPRGSHRGGYDLEPAYKLAREQLAEFEDIEQLCRKSGARYLVAGHEKEVVIEYLNQSYRITIPDIEISLRDSQEEIPIKDKVLILHYLLSAKGTPISSKLISFKGLAGGVNYFQTFSKRTIEPLVKHFGEQPHLLVDAARRLGGHRVDHGDIAVVIDAFSRVPVTIIIWGRDEEFAPRGNILFDAVISDYLSIYDTTVLCENITWKLVKFAREKG